jgi:enoyl-[acyl-carrier-protein] reductase (NADH)
MAMSRFNLIEFDLAEKVAVVPGGTGILGGAIARGQRIIDHTPMRRFGEADELVGTAIWLASDAPKFIPGIIVPVDGGFSAYGGV